MSVSGTLKVSANFKNSATADFESAVSAIDLAIALSFTNGNGSGNADRIWKDTRTLAASATENLDFSGSLTDIYGATMAFADIRAIIVTASSANTNNVQVQRASTNGVPLFMAASDGVEVRPNGVFVLACNDATGYVVTASTGDLLTITNSAGSTSVTYNIVVVGSSV